jgi:Right handed beta helix region
MREILKSIVCGALLASAAPLAAITINVPADKPTIQAGIDFAVAGDIVQVAAGTYNERIDFKGKAITVRSAAGPATTIIDGQQLGPVVHFHTGEGQGSILRGFTIRNGKASSNTATQDGGGVRMLGTSPRIINNVIINNLSCGDGAGISVYSGSPLISGNTISNNAQSGCSGGSGGGISVIAGNSTQITNNTIQNNSHTYGGGIGINGGGSAIISNNTISGNTALIDGGGFEIINVSNILLQQNRITGNTAPKGAGIYWSVPSGSRGPRLVNNTIAENNATSLGSGIYADGFDIQVQLVNNVIVAKSGQTAVYCGNVNDLNPPSFSRNDVYAPAGTAYGGICVNQTGFNGNISANPLFAAGTYYLQAGSPCIDKGDGMTADIPAADFGGGVRIRDGNGDGSIVIDMGIDEF